MDSTALLVRETAQNSWDARDPDADTPRFRIHVRTLGTDEQETLRDLILPGDPPSLSRISGQGFRDVLTDGPVSVIEIHDRGTVGLGGPIRSDAQATASGSDFVDLVLKVGSPRDMHLGGGTYGFGKTVAYIASLVGTVVVYTNTVNPGRDPRRRLIGSAIGDGFERDGYAHTGRHWWGRTIRDNIQPEIGPDVEERASGVFWELPSNENPGTSLMIIAPDLAGLSHHDWAHKAAETVLWHLWPKVLPVPDGSAPMDISVACEGTDLEIQDPLRHPGIVAGVRPRQRPGAGWWLSQMG